jgi:hypothetical protein
MKRPRGVTIISCLLLIQGLAGILTVGLIVTVGALALAHRLPTQVLLNFGVTSVIGWAGVGAYVLVSLLALIGGVALLLMRPWAWTLAMLLEGYALALNLWSFFQGHPFYLQMLLSGVIVFYLNTRDVYRAFQARPYPTGALLPGGPDSPHAVVRTTGVDGKTITESMSGQSGQRRNGTGIV